MTPRALASSLLGALLAVPLAACNVSSEGAGGAILFTPRDCGRLGCDFDDSVGVGGRLAVQIEGQGGVSTAGVDLVSSDPDVLGVSPTGDVGGRATWQLEGRTPGVARLEAIGMAGEVVDFLEVGVQDVSFIGLELVLGDATGPGSADGVDEAWTLTADQAVSFQVTPFIGERAPTMGVYDYAISLDAALRDGLIDQDVAQGYLYFEVPAGSYAASATDDFGHAVDVLFVVEPAP